MGMGKKYLEILKAQMAVGDWEKYPEFKGNVKSFDTRRMGGGGYHYNSDGATYTRVGDTMGRAMAELLDIQGEEKNESAAKAGENAEPGGKKPEKNSRGNVTSDKPQGESEHRK